MPFPSNYDSQEDEEQIAGTQGGESNRKLKKTAPLRTP
jgi:hypothetical protein